MFLGMSLADRRNTISQLADIVDAPQVRAIPDPFALLDPEIPQDMEIDIIRSMLLEAANPLIDDSPVPQPVTGSSQADVSLDGDLDSAPIEGEEATTHIHMAEDPGVLAAKMLLTHPDAFPVSSIGCLNSEGLPYDATDPMTGAPRKKKFDLSKVKTAVKALASNPVVKAAVGGVLKKAFPVIGLASAGLAGLGLAKKLTSGLDIAKKVKGAFASPSSAPKSSSSSPSAVNVPAVNVPAPPSTVPTTGISYQNDRIIAKAILDLMDADGDEQKFAKIPKRAFTGDAFMGDLFMGAPKFIPSAAQLKAVGAKAMPWIKKGGATLGGAVATTGAYVAASKLMEDDPEKAAQLVTQYSDEVEDPSLLPGMVTTPQQGDYAPGQLGVGSAIFVMKKGLAGRRSVSSLRDLAMEGNAIYADWRNAFSAINPQYLVGDIDDLSQMEKSVLILMHGLPKTSVSIMPKSCLQAYKKELHSESPVLSPELSSEIVSGLYRSMFGKDVPLASRDMNGSWDSPARTGSISSNKFIPIEHHALATRDLLTGAPKLLPSHAPLSPGAMVSPRFGGTLVPRIPAPQSRSLVVQPPKRSLLSARAKTLLKKGAIGAGVAGAGATAYSLLSDSSNEGEIIHPINPALLETLSPEEAAALSSGRMLVIPFIGDVGTAYALPDDSKSSVGRCIMVGEIAVDASGCYLNEED